MALVRLEKKIGLLGLIYQASEPGPKLSLLCILDWRSSTGILSVRSLVRLELCNANLTRHIVLDIYVSAETRVSIKIGTRLDVMTANKTDVIT